MHLDHRISLEPGTPSRGDTVRLEYRGLLKLKFDSKTAF